MRHSTIYENSHPGRRGVTLPDLDVPRSSIPFAPEQMRDGEIGLPELSEGQVLRHFVRLSRKNYNLEEGIYPLGSCTMKYNPRLNENMARIPELAGLHPLVADGDAQGSLEIMYRLGEFLCEITGFEGVTVQPAAGAQGEYTGLMMISSFHRSRGESNRNEVLMPDSAHGTNPASSILAGMKIVGVLSNPNTLGIFESSITELTRIVHDAGGLNYMDGANMNALLGISRPGDMGFDVCHLNLHKTFSTPHGGGGPGSGPVVCREDLIPFLPSPVVSRDADGCYSLNENVPGSFGTLLAFHGHVGVFYKAYAYIRLLGARGLRSVSENALINANYLMAMLKDTFDVPFDNGPCMHEFVASGAAMAEKGVKTLDIAKRLLDYGFHAPTVYFPLIVKEALMIEPTETESMEELDRFAAAMMSIAREAEEKPHLVTDAPVNTPVLRLDEVLAVKELCVVEPWTKKAES